MVNWFIQTVRIFARFSIQTIRTLNFIFVSALMYTQFERVLTHPQTNGLVEWFNQTLKSMLLSLQQKRERFGTNCSPICCLHIKKCPRPSLDFHHLSYCMDRQHEDLWMFYLIHGKVCPVVVKMLFLTYCQ